MGSHARRWAGPPLAAIAVLALLLGAFAAEAGAKADTKPGGKRISPRAASAAASHWTAARIARARPLRFPDRASAAAGPAAGGARAGQGRGLAARAGAADFAPVADPTAPAARVHGVVLFQLFFGAARCSGTAISSPNRSVVVTAGHCVHAGAPLDIWYTGKWAFVPGYRHGQRPFGVFPAKWLGATGGWLRSGTTNADVGIAVVGRNARGQTLNEAVGGARIAWNRAPRQDFDVHGYPVERPFDGRTQRLCADRPYLGHDPHSFTFAGPLNLGVRCRVTEGGSGGAWTIGDGVVNGVSSYGYPEDASTIFSPYFGRDVGRLYRRAARIR